MGLMHDHIYRGSPGSSLSRTHTHTPKGVLSLRVRGRCRVSHLDCLFSKEAAAGADLWVRFRDRGRGRGRGRARVSYHLGSGSGPRIQGLGQAKLRVRARYSLPPK